MLSAYPFFGRFFTSVVNRAGTAALSRKRCEMTRGSLKSSRISHSNRMKRLSIYFREILTGFSDDLNFNFTTAYPLSSPLHTIHTHHSIIGIDVTQSINIKFELLAADDDGDLTEFRLLRFVCNMRQIKFYDFVF